MLPRTANHHDASAKFRTPDRISHTLVVMNGPRTFTYAKHVQIKDAQLAIAKVITSLSTQSLVKLLRSKNVKLFKSKRRGVRWQKENHRKLEKTLWPDWNVRARLILRVLASTHLTQFLFYPPRLLVYTPPPNSEFNLRVFWEVCCVLLLLVSKRSPGIEA